MFLNQLNAVSGFNPDTAQLNLILSVDAILRLKFKETLGPSPVVVCNDVPVASKSYGTALKDLKMKIISLQR